jgi:hypothetical protein
MKLGLEISFDEFLAELQTNETIYLFALCCTLCTSTLKKKNINHKTYTQMYLIYK